MRDLVFESWKGAPAGKLFELFKKIHNVPDPAEVTRLAALHDVNFLPPPPGKG